ncbi:MAG: hypothetical protein SFW08_09330 [Gemmatimonadaceae bacterium]|nr:hypothetical protein [Gemmatimonadaceae bacterium]
MKHFHRTSLGPDAVLEIADRFFPTIGMQPTTRDKRARGYTGPIGTARIRVEMEGGHYTFIEAHSDQMGESRLDRGLKAFFVQVHRAADPRHVSEASY